jgi:glycolate oxidase FAD binding subunit
MPETFRPQSAAQVHDIVAWAAAERRPLEVCGSGTKRGFGRPVAAEDRLDVGALAGVVAYEPEELVLTARPGTPLPAIEAMLARRGQMLAFEPPDLGWLLGGESASSGTLAGAIACNLAGPRRIRAGAARDHVLGFHAVSGRGEMFKSGGRVVKNVTGFDLAKLIAGSFGTLAVLTEIIVRALPAPETAASVLVLGCNDESAVRAMTAALATPFEVSGAAHLPPAVAARSAVPAVAALGRAVTVIRIEGPAPSVAFRADALREILSPFGEIAVLGDDSATLWREIAGARLLPRGPARQFWRLSVPPARAAAVVARLLDAAEGEAFYDWGGGLVWAALAAAHDAQHVRVRDALTDAGGHATLVCAEASVRAAVPVFQPQPPALAALALRVKDAFDPHRVLNPGRMVAEG